MLVLTRRESESIIIVLPNQETVRVLVSSFSSAKTVRIGIEAPDDFVVIRDENYDSNREYSRE